MIKKPVEYISSNNNDLIKDIARLSLPKYRKEQKLFVAEGVRAVTDLVQQGNTLVYLVVTQKYFSLGEDLAQEQTIMLAVNDSVMQKVSTSTTPCGFLGVFAIPTDNKNKLTSPGLVLAQIQDPGNMGTLIRTAAALNVKTIVVVEGVDPWSPKVIQASAGTIGRVNIIELSWQELIDNAQKNNLSLCALATRDGAHPQTMQKNQLLVIGNEAHGLPADWQNECHAKITLTMPGNTESLNAAVSGSIALYMTCTNL